MIDVIVNLRLVVSRLTRLTRLFMAPGANMKAAVPLYAMAITFLLIALVFAVMFIMGTPVEVKSEGTVRKTRKQPGRSYRPAASKSPIERLLAASFAAVLLLSVSVLAGVTTSSPSLCRSCHSQTFGHAKAVRGTDPHVRVNCVSCHEGGGGLGRYLTRVPSRLLHLASATGWSGSDAGYGQVTMNACNTCHRSALSGTTLNKRRGLKMSHAEPLAASAHCLDCHRLGGGVVGTHNGGMKPCFRCHDDSNASATCKTCHEGLVTKAARVRTTSFSGERVREVKCGACHDERKSCDSCHGLRMPHSTQFMLNTHARAGAVDFWYNGGKGCAKCHTPSRRPCTRCHTTLLGRGHGPGMANSHRIGVSSACNGCHLQYAPIATRDFCKDVCHSKAAIAASPR